ncbi:rRNA maturation RNase YbeY [Veillonella caviae]|uniref:rRNA maturation RNase YbeY n=1 Tax=Veillonella caviae TaxID=248316 RepID=UPI00235615E9|nr:rRNA maturation RNase YbeY [Veillonella caviae]MDD7290237.1 rRNA maturation RNase YbeY [Veillonella caviae]MDY4745922.1 rRNA maturation RNase YbeY [Veillonella caviae]
MHIHISYDEGIKQDTAIESIIQKVCDEVSRVYGLDDDELSILLCNNEKIHELNKEYRGIDRPTDVLSFALNEGEDYDGSEEENHLLGDMIISLEKTKEQAIEYGHSFERELAYLTTHSCLHILGYDHMTDEDKKEMRMEEEFVLSNLGYVREDQPYNE